jgi:processive 1,2-diacylglycerol beta-glucosyltransferase
LDSGSLAQGGCRSQASRQAYLQIQHRLRTGQSGQCQPTLTPALPIVGYTTEMDECMAAADLLIGKPGGLTRSAALARSLARVIVHPIPGQEARNAYHLREASVAIRCNTLPALAWKIDRRWTIRHGLERCGERPVIRPTKRREGRRGRAACDLIVPARYSPTPDVMLTASMRDSLTHSNDQVAAIRDQSRFTST